MVERKARSVTLEATLVSRLLCNNSIPCLVILTKSRLLWKPEVATLSNELTQINLCDIVFVRTFAQLRLGVASAKRFKLLLSILYKIGENVTVHGFVVSSLVRKAKYKWRTKQDIFWCDSGDDAELWTSTLNTSIFTPDTTRPRRLLVFVNPNAGRKRAEHTYNSIVLPLFHLSDIETQTVVTSYRGHATEYLMNCSMDGFDGVICVGGDGFLSEAIQGLLLRRRMDYNLPLYAGHLPGSSELPGSMRIGLIPAGSTDTVAFSTLGTNDVMTSVLHIVLGDDLPLDVAAIHSNEDGTFLRYALSMVGFGFFADLLKNDDSRRWMGPRRYDYSGFATFLSHTVYQGRISFLPSANRSSHLRDGVICTRGCRVCTLDADSVPTSRRHSNLVNCRYALAHSVDCLYSVIREKKEPDAFRVHCSNARHVSASSLISGPGSSWCPVKLTTKLPVRYPPDASCLDQCTLSVPKYNSADRLPVSRDSRIRFGRQKASLCESFFISNSKQVCPPSIKLLPFLREATSDIAPSWCLQGSSEGWQTMYGRFIAVSAFIQSCRCSKSPMGPSPCAHLGDGCMDLILISKCTRKQFLQYLLRVANGSIPEQNPNFEGRQKSGAFDLPFVTALRVCAFEFHADPTPLDLDVGVPNGWTIPLDARNGFVENTKLLHPASHKSHSCIQGRCRTSQQTHRSVWCSDGELVQHSNISIFVHRQLIRVFARGLESL